MNPEDIFLPNFLAGGPFLGKQIPFLHYGRPARPVRWGKKNRGFSTTIFTGTGAGGGSGSGAGNGGYGDPVLIEGPGPMYGETDNEDRVNLTPSNGGPILEV